VSRPRAQGSGTAGAGLPRHRITRVRFTTLDPPFWGKLHAEERCRHGKIPKSASVSEGLGCSSVVCFCTEIRSAFCIVPVQASGIFGQVRLACACLSFASACAHALIHRSCALVSLSTLELSLSRLLARSRHSLSTSPSSSLLPSVYFSLHIYI